MQMHQPDKIHYVARFALSFQVQTYIQASYSLGWRENSTPVMYVDLKSYEEDYVIHVDKNLFEFL